MPSLKANIGGSWVELGGSNEVYIGPADPGGGYELWYDTDDPGSNLVNTEAGSYTPTLTGMAIGTGGSPGALNTGAYQYVGTPGVGGRGLLSLEGVVRFGATSITLPTGAIAVGLPSGFNFALTNGAPCGQCFLTSSGVTVMQGLLSLSTVSSLSVWSWVGTPATAPIFPQRSTPSSTAPFTWKANDQITWQATFPAVHV